jgi:hypothetical protein
MKNQITTRNRAIEKNFIWDLAKSLMLFLLIASVVMSFTVPAFAQDIGSVLEGIGTQTGLPGFGTSAHANASVESGASNITSAIFFVVDLVKYGLGAIAVIMVIFIGIKLITTGKNIEQSAPKMKEALKYIAIGLIVVMIADPLVRQVFFGEAGEVYRSETDAILAAQRGSEQIRGLYSFIEIFMGVVAVLMIIIYAVKMVTSQGNEETIKKSQKGIMWAVAGIMLIGVSELLVKDIVFPKEGSTLPDITRANELIVTITNFASGFISIVAIAMYMYSGILYFTAGEKADLAAKAKKVFFGATIGLLVAMGAYAIVNTFIKLEPLPFVTTQESLP